jgi:hypothetical protein
MRTEVYVVDPDVWKNGMDDPRCHVAILDVWQKPHRLLALDGGEIEREYLDLMQSQDVRDDLRKLLQDIFNQRERSNKLKNLAPTYSPELQSRIARWGCDKPVEPLLIGMAAASVDANVKLLLVGEDRLRQRGLHSRDTVHKLRDFFRSRLHKRIEVIHASRIGLPRRDELVQGYERLVFEQQVQQLFMQRVYQDFAGMPCFRKPTPSQVENYKDEAGKIAGEIDVYLYLDLPEARYVWVCECELREAGNEGQPTTEEKVLKLRRKVEAARAFEMSQGRTAVVKGYMITNAHEPLPQANTIIEACELQFCSVTMPKKWETDYRWCLRPDAIELLAL